MGSTNDDSGSGATAAAGRRRQQGDNVSGATAAAGRRQQRENDDNRGEDGENYRDKGGRMRERRCTNSRSKWTKKLKGVSFYEAVTR